VHCDAAEKKLKTPRGKKTMHNQLFNCHETDYDIAMDF